MKHVVERQIGNQTLTIETGQIARQSSGSVIVKYGGTIVFGSSTFGNPPPYISFFPLTIDYRERASAAGKIPGGFFKREGRPTTKEVLTCRLLDRPMRPLFPDGYFKEVAVNTVVLSADRINDPDVVAMVAGAASLAISEIPFNGPIAGCRVGLVDGEFVINPSTEQRAVSDLDLIVAGTERAVTMVECGAKEVPEDVMLDAIDRGFETVREICAMINELVEVAGKEKKEFVPPEGDEALENRIHEMAYAEMKTALRTEGKHERKTAMGVVSDGVMEQLCPEPAAGEERNPEDPDPKLVKEYIGSVKKAVERDCILNDQCRSDGRRYEGIRQITSELAMLPYAHGSSLFTRGETQSIVTLTLGTSFDEQRIDGLHDEVKETFMLHYSFPSYCVGESWPNRGPKRREIGHGALAERALRPVLPAHDDFPYTVRIVSDIMESNGSSSMASVCGGTLALMDAGVPISQPVAGIAMGLVADGDRIAILSDILGSEDAHGDMDFKVAGTQRGITALQMDIKIEGLPREIMVKALEQAREGRIHILKEMLTAIRQPRSELSPLAPRAIRFKINPEKIGLVIGPGGKMIKGIQEETGSRIEIVDDGTVTIWGSNQKSADDARAQIDQLTEDVKIDTVYSGRVVSIKDFGCFVEVLPGQEGLVHVSELSDSFVDKVSDVVRVGDQIEVKVIDIDPQGRIKLSRKVLLTGGSDDGDKGSPSGGDRGRERSERGGRDRGGRGGGGRGGQDRDRGRGGRDRERSGGRGEHRR